MKINYLKNKIAWRQLHRARESLERILSYPRLVADGFLHAQHFNDIRMYCMFIGCARTGHTLVGALLNAHPNALIAHELDALAYVDMGVSRNQLYARLLRQDRIFGEKNRRHTGYDYDVPNQSAGCHEKLLVIGDKRGAGSSLRLANKPHLLDRLRRTVAVPVRIIHHVRNPYDTIATEVTLKRKPLPRQIDHYFRKANDNNKLLKRTDPAEYLTTYHEALIASPKTTLKQIIEFVGLEPIPEYLDGCASVVFPAPRKTRLNIDWPDHLRHQVADRMQEYEYLRHYRFED
jgi:hypothetical protein